MDLETVEVSYRTEACVGYNTAFERGHILTAQSNWLRAINYYQASTFAFDAADGRRQDALRADLWSYLR